MEAQARVVPFERLRMTDVERVGGKNASLGEMISQLAGAGIRVPGGFATTAFAFREFLAHNDLEARIAARLAALDVDDVRALAAAGAEIRGLGCRRDVSARIAGRDSRRFRCAERRGAGRLVGGAIVGDGRGPARGLVRWTAGNIS